MGGRPRELRHRYLAHRRAQLFEVGHGLAKGGLDLRIHHVPDVLPRHADAEARHAAVDAVGVVDRRGVYRG